MDITQMTVAQVANLLTQNNVPPHIINMLRNDSRVSIIKLLHKWHQRQLANEQEIDRVQKLYAHEHILAGQGYERIAGVDEAGRGPLAGPVVVAAVILPLSCHLPLLNDSKKLTAHQREELYCAIKNAAIAVNHSVIDVTCIDEINIYQATVNGMYEAIAGLAPQPQAVLIDAVPLHNLLLPSLSLVGGDAISASIAAASIIAKVERDHIMDEWDREFPMYGFIRHKGYGTREHLAALNKYGPCNIHRRSFEPVKSWGAKSHECE